MKRPLLIVAISYIIGIIIGVYLKQSIPIFILLSIVITITYLTKKTKSINKIGTLKITNVILITILISSIQVSYLNNKYNNIYVNLDNEEISLIGTICSQIQESDYYYNVTIKVNSKKTSSNENKELMSKNNYKQKTYEDNYNGTKLIIYVKKSNKQLLEKLKYGNQILITGTYNEPEVARNYKGFDYKEYLKSKGIYGSINLSEESNIKVIKEKNINLINRVINQLSLNLKENIEAILSQEQSALCKGILLGDSSSIDDNIKENFEKCNLSHMLAVSGTHVSYLIVSLSLILNKKVLSNRAIKICNIIILLIFMIITNMSPSVIRAGISAILCITASLLHRQADTYSAIGFSILVTLISNPFSIFNIGMQLSYAGTIGILVFEPIIKEKILNFRSKNAIMKIIGKKQQDKKHRKNKVQKELDKNINRITQIDKNSIENKISNKIFEIKQYLIENISVTISANIFIIPLTMYHFNIVPLNFIISNLIAGPILGLIMTFGIFTLFSSCISIRITKIISIPLKLVLELIIKVTELIERIPLYNITIKTPKISSILFFYIVALSILYYIKNKTQVKNLCSKCKKILIERLYKLKEKDKSCTLKVLSIIIVTVIILVSILNFTKTNNKLEIHFVDVGQGDCTLIKTPTNKIILIDGGGSGTPEKYDIGEKVLVPYLLDRRIKYIDYIMVSHFDSDHAQGLEAVIQMLKVKNIIISKQATICVEYTKIMSICKQKGINVIEVKRGGKLTIDEYTYFEILHPSDNMLDDGKGGLNANAIVAKLYYRLENKKATTDNKMNTRNNEQIKNTNYFGILFTGDIEEEAEKELVKIYGSKLKSDILKVAHHGSKTSSTEEFLQAVDPSICLIGVGEDNTFGHPNTGVLQRLENLNTHIYRTDLDGEISIIINKNKSVKINKKLVPR